MKKNLILSAAVGYSFKQIELFVKSLKEYYHDEICLIISKNDLNLEHELKKFNCNIIKTKISKKEIQFKRYEIYLDYLNKKEFNKVLLCDCRDIYFQQNPFEFSFKKPLNFFLEDYQLKNCPYNSNWLIKTYGKNEFNKIAHKTILCSGTVLGNNEKIQDYIKLIVSLITKFKYKKKFKYLFTFRPDPEGRGCDQAHANFIVHNSKIDNFELHSNSKGPFATVFYLQKIKFDEKFRLINELGKPYVLVHQYDKKWGEFSNVVAAKKKQLKINSY